MRDARIVVSVVLAGLGLFPQLGAAQGANILTIPDPPSLPSPPVLSHLVFEQPAYVIAVLVVGAVVSYLALSARGQPRRGLWIALGASVLALAIYLTARAVETDRERVLANTTDLVRATATGDSARVGELIFDAVRLLNVAEGEMDRALILSRVRDYFSPGGRYPIQEHAILELDAARVGPNTAAAQVKVRATPTASGFPILSWWKINFQKDPSDTQWKVVSIEGLSANLPGIVR